MPQKLHKTLYQNLVNISFTNRYLFLYENFAEMYTYLETPGRAVFQLNLLTGNELTQDKRLIYAVDYNSACKLTMVDVQAGRRAREAHSSQTCKGNH